MSKSRDMSFLDHLEELRWHIIRSTISILLFATVAFLAKDIIFDQIIFGPKKGDFISYQVFCSISQSIGGDAFCFEELPFRIQSRTVSGQFSAHLWTSILAGFILSFPYVIFEFWKFISPGLYEKERKNARGFIFIASMLFFIGVLFGYYIVTPLSINFLGNYSVSSEIFNDFDLIITPSAPGEALKGLEYTGSPMFNTTWSLSGNPCITLPLFKGDQNLPIGCQLVTKFGDDNNLLNYAKSVLNNYLK